MARRISEAALQAIEDAVRSHPDGVSLQQIASELGDELPRRTLQYRLKHLVEAGRLDKVRTGRWTCYSCASTAGRATLIPLPHESAEQRLRTAQAWPIAKQRIASALKAVEGATRNHPGRVKAQQIAVTLRDQVRDKLPRQLPQRLQQLLVETGHLSKKWQGHWASSRLRSVTVRKALSTYTSTGGGQTEAEATVPLSENSVAIRDHLHRPLAQREPVSYDRGFLAAYQANTTFYLSAEERTHLAKIGRVQHRPPATGNHAKQQLGRLLIELSWNSSRLEGNSYSRLNARDLIEFGQEAKERDHLEAQMILNHKDALEFLLGATGEIGYNHHTLLNLHAILANNLLPHEAAGQLRHIPIDIKKSVFVPLAIPQLIEECFEQLLAKAAAIGDPFEQALFLMVQLPYLQPFDDVNKRCSRLAANIPLSKGNLAPLSFIDVPRGTYTDAMLAVYELSKIDLIKELFIWAYERSAADYAAVRAAPAEPDQFRLQHSESLRELVGNMVRHRIGRKEVPAHIASWAMRNIPLAARKEFSEIVKSELLALHEGNYARHKISPTEFAAWRESWGF